MKLLLLLKKSKAAEKLDPAQDKLEYFRKLLLDHLETLEDADVIEKAGLPIGAIREWKGGKKYIKIGPNKWRPKYDSHTRGAKTAVAAIKRKVDAAKAAHEMMQIVLEHRDRFSDKDGHPLPFVMELHEYINSAQAGREKAEQEKAAAAGGGKKQEEGRQKGGTIEPDKGKEEIKKSGGGEKWFRHVLTSGELKQFIKDARSGKNPGNALIGIVSDLTKEKVKELTGVDVSKIVLEGTSVVHADDPKHFLEPDDLENSGKVINNPVNVSLSPEKTAQGLNVIIFEGNINGKIFFAEAVHKKNDGWLSLKTAYRPRKAEKAPTVPHWSENPGANARNAPSSALSSLSAGSGEKSRDNIDFNFIKAKYQNGKCIEGSEDEIYVGDETMKGRWKLVEADAPSASHDETTFHKTRGFPTNKDGSTINDRDYQNDRAAQEIVLSMGSNFDGRALSFDSPVVVTKDGIVVSGNNRTMSSKIAAGKGADTKYIDAVKKRAARFGFSAEDVDGFQHPRVIFEIEKEGGYSTEEFARYNQESQKSMSPIEAAVKVSKIIKTETVKDIAGHIVDFDTVGELYADHKTCMNIFNSLETGGIINQFNRNTYIDPDGVITGAGKEFLETVLIGSVVNEQNIRGLNREGCKSIRQKLVRAITPLIENKGMDGYSITKELNEAVDFALQAAIDKKFNNVDELISQGKFFDKDEDPVSVEIARKLEGTQKSFAEFMQTMNGGLKYAANGEADIFLGEVESREDILARMLNLKKAISGSIDAAINGALRFFHGLSEGRGSFEKEKVVLNRAGGNIESYRWIAKGGFAEGEHPRDGGGRFAESGTGEIGEKWFQHVLTDGELKQFIDDVRNGKTPGNALIGMVSDSTRKEVKRLTGVEVNKIVLEGTSIAHADNPKHHLKDDDIEKCAEVINNPETVKLSPKTNEQGLKIIEFKGNIDGVIYFAEAVHKKHGGWLSLASVYRPSESKVSGAPMPPISPPGLTPETPRPIPSPSLSIQSGEKSSESDRFEKSLTYSGHPLQGRTKIQGMDISIENKKGSVRSGTDKDGHEWRTEMRCDYGYIRGTVGVDKDHLDAYIGPNPESEIVYIVNQNDPVTGDFDEQKVMLGFNSEAEAEAAYLKQYDRPGFFGSIVKMDIDAFKEKAFDIGNKGKPLQKTAA